jgi:hypothetical protein
MAVDEFVTTSGDVWASRDNRCRPRGIERENLILFGFGNERPWGTVDLGAQ